MIELYVSICVLLVCLFFKFQLSHWARKKIDGPAPIPIFGNLFDYAISKKHFCEVFDVIYKSYPTAAYVGIYNMSSPALLIRDLDLVKDVLVKDFDSFSENMFKVEESLDPLLSYSPFITSGEKWKTSRAQISSILTMAEIKNQYIPLMEVVANELIEYIDCGPESKDPLGIEAKDLCAKYTTDVIALVAFGMNGEAFSNVNSPFLKITESFFTTSTFDMIKSAISLFAPSLNKILRIPFIPSATDKKLRVLMKQILQHRETSKEIRIDFLDAVLKLHEKLGPEEFDDEKIIGFAMLFLLEGFETSSTLMAFCLYELAQNLKTQKQVQNEIDKVLVEHDNKLTIESLQKMTFLDQVLAETLRLHSPVFDLKKVVTKTYQLPPQYLSSSEKPVLEPGTVVIVPSYSIHLDAKIFTDPHKFQPERFSEENKKKNNKYSFLAFGEGPRICLGIKFGLSQSKIGIVKMLTHYNVRNSPKMKLPLQFSKKSFLLASKDGIWVDFEKRK